MQIILGLLLSFLASSATYAGGCVAGERCLTMQELLQAQERDGSLALSNELKSLGGAKITENCIARDEGSRPIANRTITDTCDSTKEVSSSSLANSVCEFRTMFDCKYKGKDFWMDVSGSCFGQMHDCGTFAQCADADVVPADLLRCIKKAKLPSSKTALRYSSDAVPKMVPNLKDKGNNR